MKRIKRALRRRKPGASLPESLAACCEGAVCFVPAAETAERRTELDALLGRLHALQGAGDDRPTQPGSAETRSIQQQVEALHLQVVSPLAPPRASP